MLHGPSLMVHPIRKVTAVLALSCTAVVEPTHLEENSCCVHNPRAPSLFISTVEA